MAYSLTCPGCGRQLRYYIGEWYSTPWICDNCYHGFWVCELTPDSRARYRPGYHDWGFEVAFTEKLKESREQESRQAFARGTSALEEQIPLMSSREITLLAKRPLSPEFAEKLALARRVRGA